MIRSIIILIVLSLFSCQEKVSEKNGIILDFDFNPNRLSKDEYSQTFKSIDVFFGYDSKTEQPNLDVLVKPIIKDSIYMGIGFYEDYNKPLFNSILVHNLSLDSFLLSNWLNDMELILLSTPTKSDTKSLFLVRSKINGLIYLGRKNYNKNGLTYFATHLPITEESIRRTFNSDTVEYVVDKQSMSLHF
ncbi:MAG: hypothetical protein OCD76_25230 [Reichenbachiella sp.]